MTQADSKRLFELFQAAVQLGSEERDAYLNANCSDASEREFVEALLRADSANSEGPPALVGPDGQKLEEMLGEALVHDAQLDSLGEWESSEREIGSYKLQLELGRGSMGVVYLALQESTSQLVALKCLRPGVSSAKVVQRFEQEVAVLGKLDHPGIAKVYDAGCVELGGRPLHYFAMEFIRGKELGEYVRDKEPTLADRLKLLAAICEAVHHAHQQGIVHRDLKPANILVTEQGQPKVLDFGVSRIVDQDMQLTTIGTDHGQLIGTLSYMSPEQAGGDQSLVGGPSDVYALGVIAFEVISGCLPHDLSEQTMLSAARMIREATPLRLGSVTSNLPVDLQTIIGKALEREPGRRYASAAEMAHDLRRFLHHEPIHARAPSVIYSFVKFSRRHRALVTGTVSTIVILIAALLFSSSQWFKAEDARHRSDRKTLQATLKMCEKDLRENQLGAVQVALAGIAEHADSWEYRYLDGLADQSEHKMVGHGFLTWSVAISPDGRVGYSCGGGSRINAWNLERGERLNSIEYLDMEGQQSEVVSLAIHPDGELLAAGAHELALLDAQSLEQRISLQCGAVRIRGLAFSPDGKWLATGDNAGEVALRSVAELLAGGTQTVELAALDTAVNQLAFSADGELLAAACEDGDVRFWRLSEQGEPRTLGSEHGDPANSLSFSPDGSQLAIGYENGSLTLVEVATAEGTEIRAPASNTAHAGAIHGVGFTPDGAHLLTASFDRHIRSWDSETHELHADLVGHTDRVTSLSVDPKGHHILTGSWDFSVRVWDMALARRGNLRYPSEGVKWIAMGEAEDLVCTVARSGETTFRRASSGERVFDLPQAAALGQTDEQHQDAFALASSLFVGAGWTGDIQEVSFADGRVLSIPRERGGGIAQTCLNGSLLWGYDSDGVISIFDATTGEKYGDYKGIEDRAYVVTIDTQKRWLAASDHDHQLVRIWDLESAEPLAILREHRSYVVNLVFSPDGNSLISGSNDGYLRVWNTRDWGEAPRELLQGGEDLRTGFHPTEARLASVGTNGWVRFWDTESWEQTLGVLLPGEIGYPSQVVFSADGELLLVSTTAGLHLLDAR